MNTKKKQTGLLYSMQSLLMLLMAICLTLSFFFPVWQKNNPETQESAVLTVMTLLHTQKTETISNKNTVYVAVLVAISLIIACTSLFSYENRMRQMQLNLLNTLFLVGIMGTNTYLVISVGENLFTNPAQGSFGLGFFTPAIAMVLNSISNRFIRRDEKLVKSVDRLRD